MVRPVEELAKEADSIRQTRYGKKVFIRGLLEFTNRCICDCLYCGLRRGNSRVTRYSLSEDEIVEAVDRGFARGLRTFVLQGGEDPQWNTDRICKLLERIRRRVGDGVALTLSCGIKTASEYRRMVAAGANRYLMRFETSDPVIHARLRGGIPLSRRLQALSDLRNSGFEVGSGFMVGLPGETTETRLTNLKLCTDLKLHMVGIGPFISNPETPLANYHSGSIKETVKMTSLLRILLPGANIPATTAAGSLEEGGRDRMLAAGANVLMPNITPLKYRDQYLLYPGKDTIRQDGLEELDMIERHLHENGWQMSLERGNSQSFDFILP
jgi:biotin synthase